LRTKIFIGLDDTDTVESAAGTGRLAALIMQELARLQIEGYAVSRHQLLFDRRIPYTAKNSANVVHAYGDESDIPIIACYVEGIMLEHYQVGSDPGLCVAADIPVAVVHFGRQAQREIVAQDEALSLACDNGIFLRGLGGTNGGVIGALAGVGLAACGNDGRFTRIGHIRDLSGVVPAADILAAGVQAIRATDGTEITEGEVDTQGKVRPSLRDGQAVLCVERVNGHWRALRLD
jgi:hypothetical protein